MEHQKMLNLLNETSDSKFVTRKWNIASNQLSANFDIGNGHICNTELLKSNLHYYNNAYNLVRSDIITIAHNIATKVTSKNCLPFITSITNIDGTKIDDAEDLDLVILMYNLIEYTWNYSDATESLLFYFKGETTSFDLDFVGNNTFKSFEYKTKLLQSTILDGNNSILKKCSNRCTIKIFK